MADRLLHPPCCAPLKTLGPLHLGARRETRPLLLLTYLLLEGGALRDHLCTLLWPDRPDARTHLRLALHKLKSWGVAIHVDGQHVHAHHPCDALNPDALDRHAEPFLNGVVLTHLSDPLATWILERREQLTDLHRQHLLREAARRPAGRAELLEQAWAHSGPPADGHDLARFLSLCQTGSALHRQAVRELEDLSGLSCRAQARPVQALLAWWLDGGAVHVSGTTADLDTHLRAFAAALTAERLPVLTVTLGSDAENLDLPDTARPLTVLMDGPAAPTLDPRTLAARWPDVRFVIRAAPSTDAALQLQFTPDPHGAATSTHPEPGSPAPSPGIQVPGPDVHAAARQFTPPRRPSTAPHHARPQASVRRWPTRHRSDRTPVMPPYATSLGSPRIRPPCHSSAAQRTESLRHPGDRGSRSVVTERAVHVLPEPDARPSGQRIHHGLRCPEGRATRPGGTPAGPACGHAPRGFQDERAARNTEPRPDRQLTPGLLYRLTQPGWGQPGRPIPPRTPWHRLRQAIRLLPALLPACLDVTCAAWAVRRGHDPRCTLRRWSGTRTCLPLPPEQVNRTVHATRIVTWWLHPRRRRDGICLPRAYATYRALRRAGHPAVFVSGVARIGGAFLSHAWIEDHRGAIPSYGEPDNRQRYRALLEYPQGLPPDPGPG